MEYEEMRQMEKTHCCAQCESLLGVIWDMFDDCYKLVCRRDPHHQGYKPFPTLGQEIARGKADESLGKGAQVELEKMAAEGAPALSKMPTTDLATGRELDSRQIAALLGWGFQLGLSPYLGHVCLYYGKPYVTIDGYYYKMNKDPKGLITGTRPLTPEERESYEIAEGDIAFIAEAWSPEKKLPTTGLGIVTKDEIEGKSTRRPEEFRAPVVHGHPQRMAEKRAEWQLLRKLIPLEEQEGVS